MTHPISSLEKWELPPRCRYPARSRAIAIRADARLTRIPAASGEMLSTSAISAGASSSQVLNRRTSWSAGLSVTRAANTVSVSPTLTAATSGPPSWPARSAVAAALPQSRCRRRPPARGSGPHCEPHQTTTVAPRQESAATRSCATPPRTRPQRRHRHRRSEGAVDSSSERRAHDPRRDAGIARRHRTPTSDAHGHRTAFQVLLPHRGNYQSSSPAPAHAVSISCRLPGLRRFMSRRRHDQHWGTA